LLDEEVEELRDSFPEKENKEESILKEQIEIQNLENLESYLQRVGFRTGFYALQRMSKIRKD